MEIINTTTNPDLAIHNIKNKKSSKSDNNGGIHGVGVQIINATVEKYGGLVEVSKESRNKILTKIIMNNIEIIE